MLQNLKPVWDLDSIFPGGSESKEFAAFLDKLKEQTASLTAELKALEAPTSLEQLKKLESIVTRFEQVRSDWMQASSFVSCLEAQNVHDGKAHFLRDRVTQLGAANAETGTLFDQYILEVPEDLWKQFLELDSMKPIAFILDERRQLGAAKLPTEQEILAGNLAVDGYHAWSQLYDVIVGRMHVPSEKDGKIENLSVGQAFNLLSDTDPTVRKQMFANWKKSWSENEDLCAKALNHLSGFRLALYKERKWDDFLKEPVEICRMSEKTLNVMWEVVEKNRERLVPYLKRKKELLGIDSLSFYDWTAPLPGSTSKMSYDEAAQFITEQFEKFSPKMAEFATMAFEKHWIEAEDRPGKRPGGFCTDLQSSKETRIFMTFDGSMSSTSTLAHELGHSYHTYVMKDLPELAKDYAMNVAETASTFAELIVKDAALKNAKSDAERISMIDDKLGDAVSFFMDIFTRFTFEKKFYEQRKNGMLSAEEINQLMEEAQKFAFAGALDEYFPNFWSAKLHFYISDVPFYNFPYTFGYMLSAGLFAQAQKEGASFEDKYIDFLKDTGRMTVEDLAKAHLNVDLTQPDFWQSAVDAALANIDEFMTLTEKKA
ncbi:M3 family oligoendopeptidase [Brevibacillus laterosporus]|uniref:M3 family oligoendopeptidase n=1 Tax=Brevibacillus laterosporus TaxID=1465 RepID=A0AAP3DGR8_BRELA|nr:M3 family oligoendopeptidase [Brevibacillus laterosporus]AYB39438.1 M3 family oligoendopeptidase [Brevibacillus laterosporus]MBG9796437.1 oligoendopeptidase [Brevibacillus laterosporus]MBM7107952.1 Oligoendopeptidase F, plasmid [Brevibacillus laterosporus]MCR8937453.1 M3 family oligoendopeptidase [Brevibacillus laterosporus]MCR8979660.1 M3 family oligoendopeptidase [Brevibacillus laterosporus]